MRYTSIPETPTHITKITKYGMATARDSL